MSFEILIARGNFYLSRELCDTHLSGVESVALLARSGVILIVPLARGSAGGLLLKQRNARGDRVIHAQEFIREKGYPEQFEPRTVAVHWNTDSAALSIDGFSPM
jgi:hypothetical protein